jgi:hypothetical protein
MDQRWHQNIRIRPADSVQCTGPAVVATTSYAIPPWCATVQTRQQRTPPEEGLGPPRRVEVGGTGWQVVVQVGRGGISRGPSRGPLPGRPPFKYPSGSPPSPAFPGTSPGPAHGPANPRNPNRVPCCGPGCPAMCVFTPTQPRNAVQWCTQHECPPGTYRPLIPAHSDLDFGKYNAFGDCRTLTVHVHALRCR